MRTENLIMTTTSIRVPNVLALSIDWFRRSWRAWFYRLMLDVLDWQHGTTATNLVAELSATRLLARGHAGAAVWASRTKLELKMSELCDVVMEGTPTLNSRRQFGEMIYVLMAHGALSKRMARRCNTVYGGASRIVHLGTASRDNAAVIIREIDDILTLMERTVIERVIDGSPTLAVSHKPILGFATAEAC
jgi:hypothetical protein